MPSKHFTLRHCCFYVVFQRRRTLKQHCFTKSTVSGDKDDVPAEPSVQPPLAISPTLTDSSRSTRNTDDAMSTSQIPVNLKVNVGSRVPSQGPYCVVADNIESVSGETFSDVSSVTAIDGIVMGDAYISGESILTVGEEGCTLSIRRLGAKGSYLTLVRVADRIL